MLVLTKQMLQITFMHVQLNHFFVSTNVREIAAFSRAVRVFVQEESPLLP